MDPFTHTFVGLAAAKAGLERSSPLATTVCILAANSPDSDIVMRFVAGPSDYLHHHRGITHSIIGVLALAVIVPSIVWVAEHGLARLRRTQPRSRYRGLLVASLIVTATHPLMDWTNNYGVRPFLPWDGRWFYGDLVFIIDPYVLVLVGGAAFLANSGRRSQVILWAVVASLWITAALIALLFFDRPLDGAGIALAALVIGVVALTFAKYSGITRGRERIIAAAALALVVVYWVALGLVHRTVYREATQVASQATAQLDERVNRVAAMPTLANPLRWLCVAETDRAIYRYFVKLTDSSPTSPALVDGYSVDSPGTIERFEKPTGHAAAVASAAAKERHAKILLNFSRFPIARVRDESCITRTIVEFADLRYTEPGTARGSFSANVPVECPK